MRKIKIAKGYVSGNKDGRASMVEDIPVKDG